MSVFEKLQGTMLLYVEELKFYSTSVWALRAMDFAYKFIFIKSDELFSENCFRKLLAAVHFSHTKF